MPRIAYVNGSYVAHRHASVHIEDRGFQFADGVYEVIALINGEYADARGHLDRLERSLNELSIVMPVPRQTLMMIIREVVRKNHSRNASIYIQISRGVAARDFKFPTKSVRPSLIVTIRPFKFDGNQMVAKGGKAVTVPDIRWKRPDIKSTSLLPQVLAKQQAAAKGAYEALMVDDEGFITEGSSSNAWMVKGAKLITRKADGHILRGVTRTALLALCDEYGITFEERSFTVEEAEQADELFCTGAVALIVPLIELNGKPVGSGQVGPVARKLYEAYRLYAHTEIKDQQPWSA